MQAVLRNKFGGMVYEYDFNTECQHSIYEIAQRIASDERFDNRCRKILENRKQRNIEKG